MTVIHISNIIMSVTPSVSFLLLAFLLFFNIHAHFVPSFNDQNLINDQHLFKHQEVIQSAANGNERIAAITAQEQQKMLKKQAAMDLVLPAIETRNMNAQKSRSQQYFHRQVNGQSNKQTQQKQVAQTQSKDSSQGYENYQNIPKAIDHQETPTVERTKISLNDLIPPTLKQKQSSSLFSEGENYGRSELESDFVNHQEKALYFRFVEMLAHLVNNIYRGPNTSEHSSLTLQSKSLTEQPLITAPQGNSTERIQENVEENVQSTPKTLKSYTMESASLAEDAQNLVRKRKKLSFIICIMSFGIASITLIKILEATEKRKRSQRGGVIKVPSEEYEIQQI